MRTNTFTRAEQLRLLDTLIAYRHWVICTHIMFSVLASYSVYLYINGYKNLGVYLVLLRKHSEIITSCLPLILSTILWNFYSLTFDYGSPTTSLLLSRIGKQIISNLKDFINCHKRTMHTHLIIYLYCSSVFE